MTQDNHAQTPQTSRIAQLAALQRELDTVRHVPGYRPYNSPEANRIHRKIAALENSFVLYQGQEIDAELVNEMDGSLNLVATDSTTLDAEGHERIYRTSAGQYFIRRKLCVLDVDGDNERRASGRTFVHRISATAAALWATMRCCPRTDDLRRDLRNQLQDIARLLDEPAHALMDRYLSLTPYAYSAADIVNGCVEYALGHAFRDIERYHAGTAPEEPGFADDGWGYVEEAICGASHRHSGEVGRVDDLEEDADAPLRMVDLRGKARAHDPAGVALLAAPAVAPAPTDGKAIRDVLAEIAADWLGKAVEARQQSQDFASTLAESKLSAQADLLEGCAAALYAALDGKEGQ